MMNRIAFLLPIFLVSSNLIIHAAILDDSIPPGNNYDMAAFRFWYPDDYQTIKGVIVLIPGSNGDGRDWVLDESWQAHAQKHNFALPGLIFTGENDYPPRKDILKGIYSLNRRVGALWVFAEEPKAGHEIGQTQKLAGVFFDEIIPLRLQETASGSGVSSSLKTISISQGFAGDLKTKKFIAMTDDLGNYFAVSWLPTLKFTEAWQSFGKNKPF